MPLLCEQDALSNQITSMYIFKYELFSVIVVQTIQYGLYYTLGNLKSADR